ncbi:MAG: hypothetical protein AAGI30_03770 [Planctomycetota bacterium]
MAKCGFMCRGILRTLTLVGLAGGTLLVVAGPDRVKMLAHQARAAITDRIDASIDDPVALRAQLRELEKQYPARIAEVRGELASIDDQITGLERDAEVARRVVELASDDLDELDALITAGDDARAAGNTDMIRVRFEGVSIPLEDAYADAARLTGTVQLYRDRVAGAERDLGLLARQREQLSDLLIELETERARYQTQLAQLEGQIEMIARNDALIDILEERQTAIDELEDFKVASLDQVSTKMNRVHAEQQARLDSLFETERVDDYEAAAQAMLDAEQLQRSAYEQIKRSPTPSHAEGVTEITPRDLREQAALATDH